MASQDTLIETLTVQLKKLAQLTDVFYTDYEPFVGESANTTMTRQRFLRWYTQTSALIKKHINIEEEERFKQCDNNMQLKVVISNCVSYLKVLIDDIKDNPDHYKNISEISKNDNFAIGLLNNMHPEVLKIAKDKIQHNDYKNIILDVCIALENYVKKRINSSKVMDLSGAKLMEYVFSKDRPIIELSNKKEEQRGFMFLFSGIIKAIRNQCSHKVYSMDLQEALEILGFLSLLFRTVDKGKVQK